MTKQLENTHKHIEVFRHELKYLINRHDHIILSNKLKCLMGRDVYADESGNYHIRSLYFDDYNDTSLYEKQIGTFSRKKYRIRIYNLEDNVIKLEKKCRVGQYINKSTLNLSSDNVRQIKSNDFNFLRKIDNPLAREFYLDLIHKLYKPKVIVDYVREAFTLPFNNIRVTFDKYLSTGLESTNLFDKNLPLLKAIEEPLFILEVKYSNFFPDHLKSILQFNSDQKLAISKYAYCRKYTKSETWEDQ
jgi:hypothetical protein